MKNRLALCTAALSLAAVGFACGGDDAGGAGGSSLQAQLANRLISDAGTDGMEVDEDCVRRVISDLSNADARALLDESEEDLSPQGGMTLLGIFECLDFDFDLGDLDN